MVAQDALDQRRVELRVVRRARLVGAERPVHRRDRAQDRMHAARGCAAAAMRSTRVVVEDDRPDPIAGAERHPGAERRELGRDDRLHRAHRAEEHRHALIDDEDRRAVALLGVGAHLRLAGAERHLPVDGPDVVAREVGADLVEVEAAAAEARRRGGRRGCCGAAGAAGTSSPCAAASSRTRCSTVTWTVPMPAASGPSSCAPTPGRRRPRGACRSPDPARTPSAFAS